MINVCKCPTKCSRYNDCASNFQMAVQLISSAFLSNHKLLVCGNGGSCSDSDHIVAEFIKTRIKANDTGYIGFKAISLCSNSSVLTAISNDYGFNWVYAQQVYALGDPGDVLLAISTSGKSENVRLALEAAHKRRMHTILLTGCLNDTSQQSECTIQVCGRCTEDIQEKHIMIYHGLCKQIIAACVKERFYVF